MTEKTKLFEIDSLRDYYTWSNKHSEGTIYSRIDRFLGNVEWDQYYLDTTLKILPPCVFGYALIYLIGQAKVSFKKYQFKFINCIVDMEGYEAIVTKSWRELLEGKPMYMLWQKFKILQPILKNLSKPLLNLYQNIIKERSDFFKAWK